MCVREESFFDVQSVGSAPLYARGLRGLFGLPHFLDLSKKCIFKQTLTIKV